METTTPVEEFEIVNANKEDVTNKENSPSTEIEASVTESTTAEPDQSQLEEESDQSDEEEEIVEVLWTENGSILSAIDTSFINYKIASNRRKLNDDLEYMYANRDRIYAFVGVIFLYLLIDRHIINPIVN